MTLDQSIGLGQGGEELRDSEGVLLKLCLGEEDLQLFKFFLPYFELSL